MTRPRADNAIVAGMLARRRGIAAPAPAPQKPARVIRIARTPASTPAPASPTLLPPVTLPDFEEMITSRIKASRVERREARQREYLHVSSLISGCMRKIAIEERFNLPIPPQQLSFMDSTTFAQGDAIADVVMRRLATSSPAELWGKWRCACNHLHVDEPCLLSTVDLSDVCERCGKPCDTYVEVSQYNEEYKIVGNPDALLYFKAQDAFHIAELKSIAHAQFLELVRPKPEHVVQSLFYWWLMHQNGYRLGTHVSVFYTTKGYVFPGQGDPYKEFTFDAQAMMPRLQDYLDDARTLRAFREGGALPPRIHCAAANSPEAKKCSSCHICFAEEFNAR